MVNEKITLDMVTKAMAAHIEQGYKVPNHLRLHPYDMRDLVLASAAYFQNHQDEENVATRPEISTLRLGTIEIKSSILVKRGTVELVNAEQLYEYDPELEARQIAQDEEERKAVKKAYFRTELYCAPCGKNTMHQFNEPEQRYKCGVCGQ